MRLKKQGFPRRWLISWYALGLLLMALGPTLASIGLPFWALPERLVLQVPMLMIGYLATALILTLLVRRSHPLHVWEAMMTGLVAFATPFLFLLEFVNFAYSRIVVVTGVGLGLTLTMAPHILPARKFGVAWVMLTGSSGAILLWATFATTGVSDMVGADTQERTSVVRRTGLHDVRITHHRGLVRSSSASGGGLGVHQGGIIVANGVGEFHRLSWEGSSLLSQDLDLPPLMNRDAFLRDNPPESNGRNFRLMDVLVDTLSFPHRILASHSWWSPQRRCISMRVSAIPLPEPRKRAPDAAWDPLFTAHPCVPYDGSFGAPNGSGGRMAWTSEGDLLLALGNMGSMGAQRAESDYGKILVLDLRGDAEVLSLGHRNPQGLLVLQNGAVWSTEHGPRGGDELNLIVRGRNYGWPLVTYGTEYDSTSSPQGIGLQDHGSFQEPVHSWVPSVGVSQLLEVGPNQFPSWNGDLLVGSLAAATLFRVRIRAGRVIYAEPIFIGQRLRDIVEDGEGRVLMLSDPPDPAGEPEVVSLANADLGRAPR